MEVVTEPKYGCTLCGSDEDSDTFVFIGKATLCRNCRTCQHERIQFEHGRDDVCRVCLRQLFTYDWFWGPRIEDPDAYAQYGKLLHMSPEELLVWTVEEEWWVTEERYGLPFTQGGDAEAVSLIERLP